MARWPLTLIAILVLLPHLFASVILDTRDNLGSLVDSATTKGEERYEEMENTPKVGCKVGEGPPASDPDNRLAPVVHEEERRISQDWFVGREPRGQELLPVKEWCEGGNCYTFSCAFQQGILMELSAPSHDTSELFISAAIKVWDEYQRTVPEGQLTASIHYVYRRVLSEDDHKLVQYVLDKPRAPAAINRWAHFPFFHNDFEILVGLDVSYFPYKLYTRGSHLMWKNVMSIAVMRVSGDGKDYRIRYDF